MVNNIILFKNSLKPISRIKAFSCLLKIYVFIDILPKLLSIEIMWKNLFTLIPILLVLDRERFITNRL
ncbi:hypothetical protein Phpb_01236 [Photorhabdus namnaonensis]|uniref:Uncharacterized protein n=1 Tax=Photorhabdus namnaonensis TaxID=1851568 RepID=A0A1B8YKK8_9GAMM|nr:hypothetical protein Phpb_01236 [Photorhabdus namnaonensis]